jgi:CubicO group peptidase (beta-lactamase class C family)
MTSGKKYYPTLQYILTRISQRYFSHQAKLSVSGEQMTRKTKWRMIFGLGIFAIIGAACGGNETSFPETATQTIPIETAIPTIPPELVSGPLGKQLDDLILKENPLFSGSILVAQDGEILLSKGYNFSNWELKVPNLPQTKFRISSINKPITATLIMMLVERGIIELDSQMCNYLQDCPEHWGEISIRNLLNHTSGIPEYTTLLDANIDSRLPHSVDGLIELFKEEPLNFTPGESYQYSNSNFVLLGALIEGATGTFYNNFLQQALLGPLEMENSGMDDPRQILSERAAGYEILGNALVNAPYLDMTNAFATASMYSTVEDLLLWDQALYSNRLLNEDSLELMYTPNFGADGSGGEYGLGWQLDEIDGHRRVGHTGRINGFRTYLGRYIDDGFTIILLSNVETEEIMDIIEDMELIIFKQEPA